MSQIVLTPDAPKPLKPKIPRQRATKVCRNCRQRKVKCDRKNPCSRCVKSGIKCDYFNGVQFAGDSPDKTPSISRLINVDQTEPSVHLVDMDKAKNHITVFKNTIPTSATIVQKERDILIDFYDNYNSLSLKIGNHEDHKPLNVMSLHKKDPYFAFFGCFLILNLKLNPEFFEQYLKTRHPDGRSKWMYFIDLDGVDSWMNPYFNNLIKDRKNLFKNTLSELISFATDDENINILIKNIEEFLPTEDISDGYLTFFQNYIYPLRPFIDLDSFKDKIHEIISYELGKPTVKLNIRSDLAVLSLYLVILRYSSIAVQLSKTDLNNAIFQKLKLNPIEVKAITLAELCLNFYRITRKSTLEILQALLFLRCYYRDSPEDSDSVSLTQSQNLMGIIIQSAINMGLGRDPENYHQSRNNVTLANLRRRIWHGIVEIDARACVLAGTLSVLPNERFVNVKLPILMSNDILDKVEYEHCQTQAKLDSLFIQISFLVNDLKKTSLNSLTELLKTIEIFMIKNYNLKDLISIEDLVPGSRNYIAISFKNVKIISNNLTYRSLLTQVYASLLNYFEGTSHLHKKLYEDHFLKLLHILKDTNQLIIKHFNGELKQFIDTNYNFELLPLFNTTMCRTSTLYMIGSLKLVHAVIKKPELNELFELFIKQMESIMGIYKKKIAPFYYSGLKMIGSSQYALSVLKQYKFDSISAMIKYLQKNDKTESESKNKLKDKLTNEVSLITFYNQWQINGDEITNTNSKNFFLEFSNQFINSCYAILKEQSLIFEYSSQDPLNLKLNTRLIETSLNRPIDMMSIHEPKQSWLDQFFKDLEEFDLEFPNVL